MRTYPHFRHVLTPSSTLTLPHSTGPSPSDRPWARPASSLAGDDPEPFVPTPVPEYRAPIRLRHRIGRNFAHAYIRTYRRVAPGRALHSLLLALSSASVHYSSHTRPLDDTRPPELLDALPHRVARTHLGATGRNPNAFAPIGSTIPRLGPTGSSGLLPLITTRWFSSSLSDPGPRRAPPSRRSSMVAPGQPIRVPARRRASRASPYLPSLLAGEALPRPSDISPVSG